MEQVTQTIQLPTDEEHCRMVAELKKAPLQIHQEMSEFKADLMHMSMGVSGEAGEILDAVKKHVIYNKPLDIAHLVEEMGDIEFYLEGLRQAIGVSRAFVLQKNIDKLRKRYSQGYSDRAAMARADKQEEVAQ